MKKQILLIDGENFVHSLVHSLKVKGAIRSRSQLKRIDCSLLFAELKLFDSAEKIYYTTKIQIRSAPKDLLGSLQRIRTWNDKWVPYLANQGIKFIRAGNLRVRDAKRCKNCGHKAFVLQEKGVDVRLAVDIVARADKQTALFVLSSDSDLLAAFETAKQKNTQIIYVAFEGGQNHAPARKASETIRISDQQVLKAYLRSIMAKRDYYEVLGVGKNASPPQPKKFLGWIPKRLVSNGVLS